MILTRVVRRPAILLLVATLTLLTVVLSVTHAANAATAACGNAGNYYAGRGTDPAQFEPRGAEAHIEKTEHPELCNNQPTSSSIWSMLASDNANGWGQIGIVWKSSSLPHNRFFIQHTPDYRDSNVNTIFWGDPVSQDTYEFTVNRTDDSHYVQFRRDGNLIHTWERDPLNMWNGTQAEWFGETHYQGDDVFGLPADKNDFNQIRLKTAGNAWANHNFTYNGSGRCMFQTTEFSSSHIEIWTHPLDHDC